MSQPSDVTLKDDQNREHLQNLAQNVSAATSEPTTPEQLTPQLDQQVGQLHAIMGDLNPPQPPAEALEPKPAIPVPNPLESVDTATKELNEQLTGNSNKISTGSSANFLTKKIEWLRKKVKRQNPASDVILEKKA